MNRIKYDSIGKTTLITRSSVAECCMTCYYTSTCSFWQLNINVGLCSLFDKGEDLIPANGTNAFYYSGQGAIA